MNMINMENETVNHLQGSTDENLPARLLDRGKTNLTGFPGRVLLGMAAVWMRIKDWYGANSTTGTIPNLHIDG